MSPLLLRSVFLAVAAGLGIAAAWRHATRWHALAGGAVGVGLLVALVSRWPGLSSPSVGAYDIASVVLVLLLAAETFGLPKRVATKSGLGLRNREWEYDRRLVHVIDEFNQVLGQCPPGNADVTARAKWRRQLEKKGARLTGRLRGRMAASPAWRELALDYAELMDRTIAAESTRVDRRDELMARGEQLLAAAVALRRTYRHPAQEPPDARDQSRG